MRTIEIPMQVSANSASIPMSAHKTEVQLNMDIFSAIGSARIYEGVYEITPLLSAETVLPTNGLLMRDDVTVKEIPYYETTNQSGGTTVYIAMEV